MIYRLFAGNQDIYFFERASEIVHEPAKFSNVSLARAYLQMFILQGFIF